MKDKWAKYLLWFYGFIQPIIETVGAIIGMVILVRWLIN